MRAYRSAESQLRVHRRWRVLNIGGVSYDETCTVHCRAEEALLDQPTRLTNSSMHILYDLVGITWKDPARQVGLFDLSKVVALPRIHIQSPDHVDSGTGK
jgi:hypothetical protein